MAPISMLCLAVSCVVAGSARVSSQNVQKALDQVHDKDANTLKNVQKMLEEVQNPKDKLLECGKMSLEMQKCDAAGFSAWPGIYTCWHVEDNKAILIRCGREETGIGCWKAKHADLVELDHPYAQDVISSALRDVVGSIKKITDDVIGLLPSAREPQVVKDIFTQMKGLAPSEAEGELDKIQAMISQQWSNMNVFEKQFSATALESALLFTKSQKSQEKASALQLSENTSVERNVSHNSASDSTPPRHSGHCDWKNYFPFKGLLCVIEWMIQCSNDRDMLNAADRFSRSNRGWDHVFNMLKVNGYRPPY